MWIPDGADETGNRAKDPRARTVWMELSTKPRNLGAT